MLFAALAIAPRFDLSVESVMRSVSQLGRAPRALKWSADGSILRFTWAKADGSEEPAAKEYWVSIKTGELKQGAPPSFADEPFVFPTSVKPDKEAYIQSGEVWIRNNKTGETKQVTHSAEGKDNARLVLNDEAVVYTSAGKLYRVMIGDGSVKEMAEWSAEPYPTTTNTSTAALAKTQTELFKDFPRGNVANRQNSGRFGGDRGEVFYSISPSKTHAYALITQSPPGGRIAEVPTYVTRSGYTEMFTTYPKVGEPQTRSKLRVVDLRNGKTFEIAPTRPGRVTSFNWRPDGKFGYVTASTEDNKDSWIYSFEPETGEVRLLWNEHDEAWVGGPSRGTIGWMPDYNRIYFTSEMTGFSQLLSASLDGKYLTKITQGDFEVSRVSLDTPRNRFIFVSSEGSPYKRHIDAVSFSGGPRTKLADYSADEDASFAMAPNGKDFAVVRSKSNRPPELFINDKQITTTPTSEWLSGPWIDPPIVEIPTRDGKGVPAKVLKSPSWRPGGPAVVFIHGAGYLQNVFDGWSHYFREYMFHHVLMEKGYLVIDIDYRASSGYGKAWRTGIYRHMGGKDLDDAVDSAKWLVAKHGVDPKRIGIYGGSYGGFLTLMAMFTAGDTFAAGAALRPVTDWAHYNHGYTAPILNLPQNDPVAYRQSSPIYFAEGLKGHLLICHGMVDTNVHFQDTVRLVQRLIDLGKQNWSVAPYPIEDHAFRTVASWTDEYRRILELFENSIGKNYGRRG